MPLIGRYSAKLIQQMTEINYLEIDERPWGKYFVLQDEDSYKVKRIEVSPNSRLSLQSHKKREENWVCIEGELTVYHGESIENIKKTIINPGQSIYLPLGIIHRAANETDSLVKFIEVQTGTYFGEDDITRYEDDYDRK